MSEPKRYSPDIPMDWDLHFKESGTGMILRADDPAIVSALKDSEDLQTIQHLVGAHSVDEIKEWKRSHEGMEKLEAGIKAGTMRVDWENRPGEKMFFLTVLDGNKFARVITALSLIEAIEQIPAKE